MSIGNYSKKKERKLVSQRSYSATIDKVLGEKSPTSSA
jgi:hypothetical protein